MSATAPTNEHLLAFYALLDPNDLMPGHTVSDSYALRHLIRQSGGLPDSPSWLRPQAWLVLLGLLPSEKKEWRRALAKRRRDYYQFVADLLPSSSSSTFSPSGTLSERDALLNQIYQDISRSRKNAFAFYQADVPPSADCPLTPWPATTPDQASSAKRKRAVERLSCRHDLLRRLAQINSDFAEGVGLEYPNGQSRHRNKDQRPTPPTELHQSQDDQSKSGMASPAILLSSPTPMSPVERSGDDIRPDPLDGSRPAEAVPPTRRAVSATDLHFTDVRWHSLLRVLYIYALLNPSTGYVQGQNEVAFIMLYVLGKGSRQKKSLEMPNSRLSSPLTEDAAPTGSGVEDDLDESDPAELFGSADHAEADAFWCFSALVGEVRELYEFDSIDHSLANLHVMNARPHATGAAIGNAGDVGMAGALKKMSRCLKWLDRELWAALLENSLDPRLPYYSFRWLACLLSTELSFPSVVRVWDVILSEQSSSSDAASNRAGWSAKIDILIDMCCALLIHIRIPLLMAMAPQTPSGTRSENDDPDGDGFSRAMSILQAYPDLDIRPVIELTYIFRQRRLAASLTGDGPPTEDSDEEDLSLAAAMRERAERATKALREWNRSNPTESWFRGKHSSSTGAETAASFNSNSVQAQSNVLKRYAEAFQSSDAAASISKASTNWTARAMATWGNNNVGKVAPSPSSPAPATNGLLKAQPRLPSFASAMGSVSSGFSKMRRATSSSESSPSSSPYHPATFRWSRDIAPNLPLPDMLDSPAGRQEYARTARPASGIFARNFFTDTSAGASHPRSPSVSSHAWGPDSTGSAMQTPTVGINGSSPAQHGLSSPRGSVSSASGGGGGAGPKPLLLTASARPPREGSSMGGLSMSEEPSRKVSSGPLGAAAASPEARASAYARAKRGSIAGSTHSASNSLSRDASESSSTTSARTSASLISGAGVTHMLPSMALAASLSSAGASSPTNPLSETSVNGVMGKGLISTSSFANMRGPTSGERIAQALAAGAAAESAERGSVRSSVGSGSGSSSANAAYGDMSSSSEVPLVAHSTVKGRTRGAIRRKQSDRSEAGDGENYAGGNSDRISLTRTGSYEQSMSSADVAFVASPRSSTASAKRTSAFETPRAAPAPPSTSSTVDAGVTKYTLTDAPVPESPDSVGEVDDQLIEAAKASQSVRKMPSNGILSRNRGWSGSERGHASSLSRSKGVKSARERPGSGSTAGGSFSESRRGSRRGSEGQSAAALTITSTRESGVVKDDNTGAPRDMEGTMQHLVPPAPPSPGLPSPGAQDGELVDLDALLERLDRSANASDYEGAGVDPTPPELGQLTGKNFTANKGKGKEWTAGQEEAMESIGRLTVVEVDHGGLSGSDIE